MKSYEFNTKVTSDGKLEYPPNLKAQLPINQNIRVIIIVDETDSSETEDWGRLGIEQFFSDESEDDEIYNQL